MEVSQQHYKLLSQEEQHADNQWFENVDEVFSFKLCLQLDYREWGEQKSLHLNL